jgi:hypothetical protein
VTPCDSCKNRRLGGTCPLHLQVFCDLKMEATRSFLTSVLTPPKQRHISEDGILGLELAFRFSVNDPVTLRSSCSIGTRMIPRDITKVYKILMCSRVCLWRMPLSGMLRRMTLVRTDVSDERSPSIIRATRIDELGTTFAVTSNRPTLWRRYIPPKRLFLQEPYGMTSQKKEFFTRVYV